MEILPSRFNSSKTEYKQREEGQEIKMKERETKRSQRGGWNMQSLNRIIKHLNM